MRHGAATAIGIGAAKHIPPTSAMAIERRFIFTQRPAYRTSRREIGTFVLESIFFHPPVRFFTAAKRRGERRAQRVRSTAKFMRVV
jgi:hypothetical protein